MKICVETKSSNSDIRSFVMLLWKDRESLKICVEATRLKMLFRYKTAILYDLWVLKPETISKLRQYQNWENILIETISKLRQSQKLSKFPKTEWISKRTQSQRDLYFVKIITISWLYTGGHPGYGCEAANAGRGHPDEPTRSPMLEEQQQYLDRRVGLT